MNGEAGENRGQLIVLSGPSGVGKSTVIARLLASRPDIYFSVSYTTRAPRPGEQDGVNYNFVSRAEFERMIADGELLEYAEYVGNYYGTSLKVIQDKLAHGTDVLLDIEVQGAAKVRERCPEAVLVFILPPSPRILAERLRGRSTDSEDVIALRLERARAECRESLSYDYIVVNDDVDHAAHELRAILDAYHCRTEVRKHLAEHIIGQTAHA